MPSTHPPLQDAVSGLYDAHHGWLATWLRKRLGHAGDAADLAQDTFVRVLRHREALTEVREPRAYLVTIARHLLLNHQRRRSLEQAYLAALAQAPEAVAPSPEDRLVILQTLEAIDALLDGLSARVRQAFLLAQLEHLSHEAIATRLGISVRTVQRHLATAYEQCLMATL